MMSRLKAVTGAVSASDVPTARFTPAIVAFLSASRTSPARQRRDTYQPGLKGQENGYPK